MLENVKILGATRLRGQVHGTEKYGLGAQPALLFVLTMMRRVFVIASVAALLATVAGVAGVCADVQPGDVITPATAERVRDLVSPGVYWCVQQGLPIRVVPTKSIALRRAFVEATEKYAGQVRLSADGLRLENFVAGRPFPQIDVHDSQVAMKIMQNYSYALAFDDVDVRNFDADTGPISAGRPLLVERHFLGDHFRRLYYVGRLYVDPRPAMPNAEGYHYKETLHPLLEPFDLKGVGFTYYRYLDPERQDDSWLYTPAIRRVRRLSTAQRSDALFGQDVDQDSYGGYAGALAWMDWKFLGEKEVLTAFHTEHFPVKWAAEPHDWAFDDVWERRKVWVVEGTSKLAQYAYSKRVLYVDQGVYLIPYSDMYDRAGELWKVLVNKAAFGKEPFPGSPLVYDEDTPFTSAAFMVDMQLQHATRVAIPSHRFPGEPGWYWHQGEKGGTTEEEFTIAELIKSGR